MVAFMLQLATSIFFVCPHRTAAEPLSPLSCAVAVKVSGAGVEAVNGLYHEDIAELSDGVPYYAKWSEELDDYIYLYRAVSDYYDDVSYWALQSLTQLNHPTDYDVYYFKVQEAASDRPPAEDWIGVAEAPEESVGYAPNPSVSLVETGGIWSEELEYCVKDCDRLSVSAPSPCANATATVQGAGTEHLNQVFRQTENTSDCVPYYMTSNVTPALTMYRSWYEMQEYWTIRDVDQMDGEEFREWYGVWSGSREPPANGWGVKSGSDAGTVVGQAPFPVVVLTGNCSNNRQPHESPSSGNQLTPQGNSEPQNPTTGPDGAKSASRGAKLQIGVVMSNLVYLIPQLLLG